MEIINSESLTVLDQVIIYIVLALVATIFFRLILFRDGKFPDSANMIGSGFAGLIWPVSFLVTIFALSIILLAVFAEWIIGLAAWLFRK